MRFFVILMGAAALCFAASPAEARAAQSGPGAAAFDASALADAELARISGTFLPGARLTVGAVVRLADNEARETFRQTGTVAPTIVDWWWGTTGLELIANNVRATGSPLGRGGR